MPSRRRPPLPQFQFFPVRSALRPQRFRGLGDYFPDPNGGPGNEVYPYDERGTWGTNDNYPIGSSPPPPGSPGGPAPAQTYPVPSVPYGESDRPWSNPTTFASVPITGATPTNVAVLSANSQRNSLIIQNASTATVAGDVAPTLYIGFNVQASVGTSLALQPGVGIAWDIITPRDSIFVVFGPFVDTGLSVVFAGCVIQGTYSPPYMGS